MNLVKSLFAHIIISSIFCITIHAQVIPVKKYFDEDSLHVKESFFVLKSNPSILDSTYISYYYNGNKKSEGKYKNNKAVGDWMFFYEGEIIKMIGPLSNNQSNGYWKYFYENGNIRMEGLLKDNEKQGPWKFYYENGRVKSKGNYKKGLKEDSWIYYHEDGNFKAQAEYKHDKGMYYEFFEDGIVKMKGPIENEKSNGFWQYYHKNGNIESEGEEKNGLKQGGWKFYYPEGKIKSEGTFSNGKASGDWKYYYQNGNLKAEGKKINDNKTGYWKVMFETGSLQSEANYDDNETGVYTEYYSSGKLKISGQYDNGKHNDLWKYYYETGELEGICNYDHGIGYYKGYTKENKLKIEGKLRDTEKIGTWTLYNEKGDIAGYYHTYDNEEHPVFSAVVEKKNTLPSGHIRSKTKADNWKNFKKTKFAQVFISHNNKLDASIFSIEPLSPILSKLSGSYEYWVSKKYGHEITGSYLRNPILKNFNTLEYGKISKDGLSMAYRLKFYNESLMTGYVHFDNEIRYNQINYRTTVLEDNISKGLLSKETSFEYSFIFGNRYLLKREQKVRKYTGWTIDTYLGLGIGYRYYENSWKDKPTYDDLFSETRSRAVTVPLRLGISIGYSF